MENNTTKGEWKIEQETHNNCIFIECNRNGKRNVAIAKINYSEQYAHLVDKAEAEANAKLIAASPDLFTALAQIQFAVKSGAVKGLFKDEIECMNNAINKALK